MLQRSILTLSCLLFINLSSEENFVLLNCDTDQIIFEMGSQIEEQITPCSTFKIALSLIGFDLGILQDDKRPKWSYESPNSTWSIDQTPQSWIKESCVWYSEKLVSKIGILTMQHYLDLWKYGNQDFTGGLTKSWLGSSLKISPKEQVYFLQKFLKKQLLVSEYATEMTKKHLFIEDLKDGWKLFGKTGLSLSPKETGWFIGWIEKKDTIFLFAYCMHDEKVVVSSRIPRTKQLLKKAIGSL